MMTIPATTPADGELTLDASDVQFLAARLRRLFNHFKYPLPDWAKDDKNLIGISPTCIGAVLANLNRADEQRLARGVLDDLASKGFAADVATPSPGKAPEPVAWRIRKGNSDMWGYVESESDADFYGKQSGLRYEKQPLYASPGKAEAERWIPVMESSPMQGEAVLVAVEFDGPGDWRIKCGGFTEERTWKVFGASWTPSHWMPLPAAPKLHGEGG